MIIRRRIRKLLCTDHREVRCLYENSINSLGKEFYNKEQLKAWSALAWVPGVLDRALEEGEGWISLEKREIAAFAVRFPMNRLALLYCRGRFARRGHGTALLQLLESHACKEGQEFLLAEASSCSYPLFLKRGWKLKSPEQIKIAGVDFTRYLMWKKLVQD